MKFIIHSLSGALGLFVDDGALALTVIAVLLAVSILLRTGAIGQIPAIALLVTGAIGALLLNVVRAAATRRDMSG